MCLCVSNFYIYALFAYAHLSAFIFFCYKCDTWKCQEKKKVKGINVALSECVRHLEMRNALRQKIVFFPSTHEFYLALKCEINQCSPATSSLLITFFFRSDCCCYSNCIFYYICVSLSLSFECVCELQGIVKGCTRMCVYRFFSKTTGDVVCAVISPEHTNENDKAVSFEEEVELHGNSVYWLSHICISFS